MASCDLLAGTLSLWRAIQLVQIGMMEQWGQRDKSLGRFGSRFAAEARQRGAGPLVDRLDALAGLDAETMKHRWALAPGWVIPRHDRSIRSRRATGEDVSDEADRRDTLRVSARYAAVALPEAVVPAWLGIAGDEADLTSRLAGLEEILDGLVVLQDLPHLSDPDGREIRPDRTGSNYNT